MAADPNGFWPIRAEQEESCGLTPLRQEGYQIERGIITPVQIIKDQHQWVLRGQRFDRFHHLAQHAVARGPLNPVL
jgi:hypothetical protein